MTFQIINPESLGAPRGYSNGMLAPAGGRLLFVAGQPAIDSSGKVKPLGFVEQFAHALDNVLTVVEEAGGKPEDIGRMTIYVSDLAAYLSSRQRLGETYRRRMGHHYPAMSLLEVKALVDENAVVEIEATAVLP